MKGDLTRIADALERIAAALEAAGPKSSPYSPAPAPVDSAPVDDAGKPESKSATLRAEHERLNERVQEAQANGASPETLRQLRGQRWHAARAASEQEKKDRERETLERDRWRRRVLTDEELAEYEKLEAASHAASKTFMATSLPNDPEARGGTGPKKRVHANAGPSHTRPLNALNASAASGSTQSDRGHHHRGDATVGTMQARLPPFAHEDRLNRLAAPDA